MKSTLIISALAAALLTTTSVQAGADANCHFHGSKPATEATVIQCATQYKDKLVDSGKLDKSWQAVAQVDQIEQVAGKRNKEWKLRFKNPAAADKSKDTLYLFYTLSGNFIAANHVGP